MPGRLLALDVTVVHSASRSSLRAHHSDLHEGAAVRAAEREKQIHYRKFHLQDGVRLIPLAYDTFGYEGEPLRLFFRQVCQMVQARDSADSGDRPSSDHSWVYTPFARRWQTRMHIALQAGSSQIQRFHLQHHFGTPTPFAEFGDVASPSTPSTPSTPTTPAG